MNESWNAMEVPGRQPIHCFCVIGFFYPVVPKGQARIRVQISAAHSRSHLDNAIAAFVKLGKTLGAVK